MQEADFVSIVPSDGQDPVVVSAEALQYFTHHHGINYTREEGNDGTICLTQEQLTELRMSYMEPVRRSTSKTYHVSLVEEKTVEEETNHVSLVEEK